jgi:hypothetical protein
MDVSEFVDDELLKDKDVKKMVEKMQRPYIQPFTPSDNVIY